MAPREEAVGGGCGGVAVAGGGCVGLNTAWRRRPRAYASAAEGGFLKVGVSARAGKENKRNALFEC